MGVRTRKSAAPFASKSAGVTEHSWISTDHKPDWMSIACWRELRVLTAKIDALEFGDGLEAFMEDYYDENMELDLEKDGPFLVKEFEALLKKQFVEHAKTRTVELENVDELLTGALDMWHFYT